MNIRMMKAEDISEVAAIEAACFSMPWSEQAFADSLAMPEALFLVAEEESAKKQKRIAGYAGCYLTAGEGEITNVAVALEYRRRGIAEGIIKKLIRMAAERDAGQIFLEVRESNRAALLLYQKCGFKKMGIRRNFYERPKENAVVMVYDCNLPTFSCVSLS